MILMINDSFIADKLIADRQANGQDGYDEVWDGIYMMSPLANNEHQNLVTEIATVLRTVLDWNNKGLTLAGANVSDNATDWTRNYRVPDVLVFLNDTTAKDCGTHWYGGPDFAIEVASPGDRAHEKTDFYANAGTRELLIIDRDPWKLTCYRSDGSGAMKVAATCDLENGAGIVCDVIPIEFRFNVEDSSMELLNTERVVIRSIGISA